MGQGRQPEADNKWAKEKASKENRLRQIIRDGEQLQAARDELGELVFQRQMKELEQRLAVVTIFLSPSPVRDAASVPPATHGAWWRRLRTWSMRSFRKFR